jgi:hypothetical protein
MAPSLLSCPLPEEVTQMVPEGYVPPQAAAVYRSVKTTWNPSDPGVEVGAMVGLRVGSGEVEPGCPVEVGVFVLELVREDVENMLQADSSITRVTDAAVTRAALRRAISRHFWRLRKTCLDV